jgi:hypothetical protein
VTEPYTDPDCALDVLPSPAVLDLENARSALSGLEPSGTVVLLLSGAADRGWAARAAVALSSAWAAEGRRIVLADLHLETPMLTEAAEGPGLEGITDVFLYGASLSRIASAVQNGAFYMIRAGTYAPDPGEIYRHPRWKKLVAGFRDTQATLVLFAPAESPDLAELSAWTSETVLLGSAASRETVEIVQARGMKVLGVLRPDPEDLAALEREEAERADAAGIAGLETIELPPPARRRRPERHGPNLVLIALVILVLLGAAFYLVATLRPELLPPELRPGTAGGVDRGGAVAREGDPLPYSVHVKAFNTLNAAREELLSERLLFDSTLFFISPEEIQGTLFYRILAGMSSDTLDATLLRDRLIEVGVIDPQGAVGTWSLVQFTPLSFNLGEYPNRDAAVLKADSLLDRQVPTYVAAVPYSDGSRRWQLYGGAFRDSVHAEAMGEMLLAAGIPADLTVRTGSGVTITE